MKWKFIIILLFGINFWQLTLQAFQPKKIQTSQVLHSPIRIFTVCKLVVHKSRMWRKILIRNKSIQISKLIIFAVNHFPQIQNLQQMCKISKVSIKNSMIIEWSWNNWSKWINCSFWAISPFATMISKVVSCRGVGNHLFDFEKRLKMSKSWLTFCLMCGWIFISILGHVCWLHFTRRLVCRPEERDPHSS